MPPWFLTWLVLATMSRTTPEEGPRTLAEHQEKGSIQAGEIMVMIQGGSVGCQCSIAFTCLIMETICGGGFYKLLLCDFLFMI